MEYIKDLRWKKNMKIKELIKEFSQTGYQSIEMYKAYKIIKKMKEEGAKIFLSFTSNMGTSGLRGLFAQLIELNFVDAVICTAGAIEEDIMKALGEKFKITRFDIDDIELYDKGYNRVGNIAISNDSYSKFEGFMQKALNEIAKEKKVFASYELFYEIGKRLKDKNSFIRQSYLKKIPIFCPAITDGSIGFQLYFAKEKHNDFFIDTIKDFKEIMFIASPDDKKGLIALGGGVSKHFTILANIINGGMDYAVYITTSRPYSGSVSGATTKEAKSWGKIKDDADSVTVVGDATIIFPMLIFSVLDEM